MPRIPYFYDQSILIIRPLNLRMHFHDLTPAKISTRWVFSVQKERHQKKLHQLLEASKKLRFSLNFLPSAGERALSSSLQIQHYLLFPAIFSSLTLSQGNCAGPFARLLLHMNIFLHGNPRENEKYKMTGYMTIIHTRRVYDACLRKKRKRSWQL